ncbi:antibiotic biosynthesis monooxygenase [Mesorhizobium sp. WSM3862]|uniref:putative quinol monooxygenase n=1 Tax=Mesorhizobium sp. WSM3862 TaxID=632858 RepID=UPI000BAF5654|nr:antibiotic biosynthesis monooxygenase [Mesorhizobium sp. WSM3862]PBB95308.1 antibiotic biosynthesis monooxygenase [Mesorhizobium sp. WSM3862]
MSISPAEAAFALTVVFDLVEGTFPEFYRLVSQNASLSVELEPGCLRFDVLTPLGTQKPSQIFLYEIYRDRAAFDLHLASAHYMSFDASTRDMVSRKTVVTYRVDENSKQAVA